MYYTVAIYYKNQCRIAEPSNGNTVDEFIGKQKTRKFSNVILIYIQCTLYTYILCI